MTTNELKQHLLNEHKRDLRLTFIGIGIIAFIVLSLVTIQWIYKPIQLPDFSEILKNFSLNSPEEYKLYYKYLVPFILISSLIYPLSKFYQMLKREKTIDKFIEKIEKGEIASDIHETTVHKIIIPLLKVKLKLCPVEFVNIVLVDDMTKAYNLPVPIEIIPDFKAILSGANMENLNKSWFELYSDEKIDAETLTTKLKTTEEFSTFLQDDLLTDLTSLDKKRADGKKTYILYLIPSILIMGGWFYIQYLMNTGQLTISGPNLLLGFIVISIIFYLFFFLKKMISKPQKVSGGDFNHQFKTTIFNRIVAFINPSFQYILHGHLNLAEVLTTGLFSQNNYAIQGNDQIIGQHNNVPFQLCDLSLSYKRNFSSEKDGPDSVFQGQVFIAKFNKKFNNELYLVPRESIKMKFLENDIRYYLNTFGEKVTLEDPEFMKLYDVYATDQIEARYILSPSLMERIKLLASQKKNSLFISFKDDRISVFNNNGTNNFETSMFKSFLKNGLMQKFYEDLIKQLEIIDQLKLNVKIWKQ